jgi:hypothetical protein
MMADKKANYIKEYPLESMKVRRGVSPITGFHVKFRSDCEIDAMVRDAVLSGIVNSF